MAAQSSRHHTAAVGLPIAAAQLLLKRSKLSLQSADALPR